MFCFNYVNLRQMMNTRQTITNGQKTESGSLSDMPFTDTNAVAYSMLNSASGAKYFKIGTGTTPASVDDYKLETPISSGYSATFSVDNDGNRVVTITNTGSTPLSISEVGLYESIQSGGSSLYCLIERTVFDAPFTIPVSGVGIIKISITY